MAMMIQVNEELALQLQAKAVTRRQTPEDFARTLLGEALQQIDATEQWEADNQRRIDLIRKSTAQSLSAAEATELQSLQDMADRRLENGDLQLLDQFERFKKV